MVCLEGIDGAGKTTAAAALGRRLRERGVSAVTVDRTAANFSSAYVEGHLARLRALIWDHPPGDPYLELGDLHWVHLQAAWYLAVGRCVVEPLLDAGTLVLTDTWTHKFLAKLALRPTVDFDRARSIFADVLRPDLVIRLDIDPVVAAARKPVITASEAGNHEGPVELTSAGFVAYQQRLAGVLDEFGDAAGWLTLDVTTLSVDQVAAALADMVLEPLATAHASRAPHPVGERRAP
nr:hypothetical protein [Micromonospora tarapacensis]